jgi:small subunit ribosomal protein S4e
MHLKRYKTPKNWPVHRKGTAYVVKPSFNLNNGIPILIILRDILKLAQNKREVKKALNAKNVLLNNKPIRDEKHSALLFDVISIPISKENYRVEISENGKFKVEKLKDSEANKKVSKIINKKVLKGKKTQLNLSDGRNFLSDLKCKVNDSVLINLKENKIEKCLELKEKVNACVFEGKHSGKKGIVNKINQKDKIAELNVDKSKINVLIKQLMVVE